MKRIYQKIKSALFAVFCYRSLRKRVLLICLLLMLLPLLFSICFLFIPITDSIVENYVNTMISGMSDTMKLTENVLTNVKYLPQNIYSNASYLNLLRHGMDYTYAETSNNLTTTLNLIFANNPSIYELRFYHVGDERVWRIDRQKGQMLEFRYEEMHEVEGYREGDKLHRFVPLQDFETWNNEEPIFTSIQYITNFPRDELLGVFAIDISASLFDSVFEDTNLYPEESICLLNAQHQVLYYLGNSPNVPAIRELIDKIDYNNDHVVNHVIGGREFVVCVQALEGHGIYALRLVPLSNLTQRANTILKHSFIIYLGISVIGLIFGFSLINHTLKPLQTLSRHMRRIEEGNLGEHMDEIGNDAEFNQLAHRFNAMSDQIEKLIRETYQLQLAQRTAELKALQMQINPHFLFNTLQNIQYYAQERNAYEINIIVEALSSIMRYCLHGESNTVSLQEELDIARQYLIIQQMRFIDRLQLRFIVEPDTLNMLIPKMTIQPLVENSIIHGMANNSGVCTISVSTYLLDGHFHMDIQDDGCGMTPDKLAEIRQSLHTNYADVLDGYNIGIRNCWLRLNLLYSNAFRFEIDSSPAIGTHIRIEIDALPGKGEG